MNSPSPEVATAAFALAPGRASAETAYGLTSTSQLIQFDTSNPSGAALVGTLAPTAGQQIMGVDFQPSFFGGTPSLFALGYNSATNFAQLYTANLATGALTTFGTGPALGTGASGSTNAFAFDFNPSSGGIRIIASAGTTTGQNVLDSVSGLASGTPGAPTLLGNFGAFNVTDFSVIPEPGAVALSALGFGALAVAIRRRKKA